MIWWCRRDVYDGRFISGEETSTAIIHVGSMGRALGIFSGPCCHLETEYKKTIALTDLKMN